MFKDFIQGIKNIIKWFPLIYKDRDWDYHFLLKIMEFKFNKIHYELSNSQHLKYTNTKAIKSLNICANLLDRLKKNEYNEDRLNKIMEEAMPIWKQDKEYEEPKDHFKIFTRENNKAINSRKQDKELFCKLFIKYLDTWWD